MQTSAPYPHRIFLAVVCKASAKAQVSEAAKKAIALAAAAPAMLAASPAFALVRMATGTYRYQQSQLSSPRQSTLPVTLTEQHVSCVGR